MDFVRLYKKTVFNLGLVIISGVWSPAISQEQRVIEIEIGSTLPAELNPYHGKDPASPTDRGTSSIYLLDDAAKASSDPFVRLNYIHRANVTVLDLLAYQLMHDATNVGLAESTRKKAKDIIDKHQQRRTDDEEELRLLLKKNASDAVIERFFEQLARAKIKRERESESLVATALTTDELESFTVYVLKLAPLNSLESEIVADFLELDEDQRRRIREGYRRMRAIGMRDAQNAVATRTLMSALTPDELFTRHLLVLEHFTPEQLDTYLRYTKGFSSQADLREYASKLSPENAAKLRKLLGGK